VFWGELLGQALFAFININIINGISSPDTPPRRKLIFTSLYYALSMFINISFARDFSGGVFNPATVLFRLFRRTDRYRFKTALIYISA
jgi:glycerol uptake facilitator-like aquaporin